MKLELRNILFEIRKKTMDKSKQFFSKSKRSFSKSKRSFRRRLPPIRPGDRIDYNNMSLISRFISEQGKILSRRVTRLTLKQQRLITIAIRENSTSLQDCTSKGLNHRGESEFDFESP